MTTHNNYCQRQGAHEQEKHQSKKTSLKTKKQARNQLKTSIVSHKIVRLTNCPMRIAQVEPRTS